MSVLLLPCGDSEETEFVKSETGTAKHLTGVIIDSSDDHTSTAAYSLLHTYVYPWRDKQRLGLIPSHGANDFVSFLGLGL